jgi:dipeptidyl aminopeptidase/acylaminoacyl peptidase
MAGRVRALKFNDLMKIERLGSVAVSPDGASVAFDTAKHDAKENKVAKTIKLLDLATGKVRILTPGPGDHHSPVWSPDGQQLAFVSTREKRLGPQLWVMPAAAGEAQRVTSGYGGVGSPVWAPDSKRVAFFRSVVVSKDYKPEKDADPNREPERSKIHGLKNEKSSARVADELLFRHWDSWRDRKRNHIFIVEVKSGKIADLTPFDMDAPPISLGAGRDFDFSPKGDEIAFTMNPDKEVARSTNNCIFVLKINGLKGKGRIRCVSETEANDCFPRYSKDGKTIFYLGMKIPRYEADKFRIKAYDRKTGETRVYLDRFDRSPENIELDGESILFLGQDRGRVSIYRLDLKTGRVRQLTQGTYNGMVKTIPGSNDLLVTRETTTEPTELYRLTPGTGIAPDLKVGPAKETDTSDAGAVAEKLTNFGRTIKSVAMNPVEEFWYPGADKDPIHGFLIRPPDFNARRKYPLVLLIHGGPQGAFMDHFHYRWNAQMFAAPGAVVAIINPRGSTGYGKKFTEQISADWGGRCYKDLMLGVDYLAKSYRFISKNRVGAAGASFGGFMVNWIAGHTDRFKALVCHDGVFSAETMAYTTEELWFDEHEHGGLPHVNRDPYLKFSPHRFVKNFKTPTLVVHGSNDFRCPMSEGLGMFTALQIMGVESRFLHFPDEGHWVLQPANSEVWYHQVVGWLRRHLEF